MSSITPPTRDGGSTILSDVLVELGFASRDAVEDAVRAAQSPGTTVAGVLVESGTISEEQLARATAERHGIDYVDLSAFDVDPAAANLIKPGAARRYQAVPLAHRGGALLVAMADPADALAVDDIAAMSKLEVRRAVAARPALEALLDALPLGEEGWEGPAPSPAPAAIPAPPPAAATSDASALRDELDALKRQLAGAEAELGGNGKPAGDREVEELRTEATSLKHERDELRSEVRRVSADAEVRSGELDSLRAKLTDAETELVRVRAETDARGAALEAMRARAESAEHDAQAELRRASEADERADEVSRRVEEASGRADEASRRVAELEGERAQLEREAAAAERLAEELAAAGERAEQARAAVARMREEGERERERAAMVERDLRANLEQEERRRRDLAERLSDVESASAAAERSFEELRLAQERMRGALPEA